MNTKTALIISAAILGLGSAVVAQDVGEWDLKERMGIMIQPTGKVARGPMTEVGHSQMVSRAVALPAGTAIMRSGNKLYLLHDQRMPDGTMLFDKAGGWMAGP